MANIIITKETFEQYESIRQSGATNMFDITQVIALSQDLTREECLDIMSNYGKYKEEFGEENNN